MPAQPRSFTSRARIVGTTALITALVDWSSKALVTSAHREAVSLNPEPFSLGSSFTVWLLVLALLVAQLGLPRVNAMMLVAWGLALGGGFGNELEWWMHGAVTDFIRLGPLGGGAVYSPGDLAMYAALCLMFVGASALCADYVSRHRTAKRDLRARP